MTSAFIRDVLLGLGCTFVGVVLIANLWQTRSGINRVISRFWGRRLSQDDEEPLDLLIGGVGFGVIAFAFGIASLWAAAGRAG